MGWSYRKSARAGPFRVNVSKSGVGWSVGGKAFRTGVDSRGRTYTSVGVPGTGLSYRRTGKRPKATGCALLLVASVLGFATTAFGLLKWI